MRCFLWVDHCIAQFLLSHALYVHQWGSLCIKIFWRTCLSEIVLGKHAQSLLLSEDLVVLLPRGPCFSKQQLRHPKNHDLKLPYSEELIGLVRSCWKSALLPRWWRFNIPFSHVRTQSQRSVSLSAALRVQNHPPVQVSILTRENAACSWWKKHTWLFQVLGLPREECNSRQLLLLVSCQFK